MSRIFQFLFQNITMLARVVLLYLFFEEETMYHFDSFSRNTEVKVRQKTKQGKLEIQISDDFN
jgi:hypothetical protein